MTEHIRSHYESICNDRRISPYLWPYDPQRTSAFKVEEIVEFAYSISENNPDTFEAAVDSLHEAIDKAKDKILTQNRQITDHLVEQVDALSDLLYFTYGSFSLLGVNPDNHSPSEYG